MRNTYKFLFKTLEEKKLLGKSSRRCEDNRESQKWILKESVRGCVGCSVLRVHSAITLLRFDYKRQYDRRDK